MSAQEGGGSYRLELTNAQFSKYFAAGVSEDQRFAVFFGKWWGLTDKQLSRIGDLRQPHKCFQKLQYFLCHPEARPDVPEQEIERFTYQGEYHRMHTNELYSILGQDQETTH